MEPVWWWELGRAEGAVRDRVKRGREFEATGGVVGGKAREACRGFPWSVYIVAIGLLLILMTKISHNKDYFNLT